MLNKDLLLKVREQILAEPDQFVMTAWFVEREEILNGREHYRQNVEREFDILVKEKTEQAIQVRVDDYCDLDREIPNCGTAACIAGWIIAVHKKENPNIPKKDFSKLPSEAVKETAANLIGIPGYRSQELFYLGNWPSEFYDAWKAARTTRERAEVAAARIDHYIVKAELYGYADELKG